MKLLLWPTVGFLPLKSMITPNDLSAVENLGFAATMLGVPTGEIEARTDTALADVGLAAVAAQRVATFSAGMRKRLALARLLLSPHSLMLLDEPHAALDEAGMALVDELLARWREAGITVLIASHAVERLAPLVDGSVRLEDGLVAEISGAGVSHNPAGSRLGAPAVAGVDS